MSDAEQPAPTLRARAKRQTTRIVRAAATRIQLGNRKVAKAQGGKREDWQVEAYSYYEVGIIKQLFLYRGNQMAKVRLFPAVRPLDDPEGAPIPVHDPESGIAPELARRAQVEIERIKGQSGGTPEILRLLDLNKQIAGECFIVGIGARSEEKVIAGETVEVVTPEQWDVRSILEVEIGNDGVYKVADPMTGVKAPLDPKLDTCVRVWQRHPGMAKRPDCHMKGVLSDLETLVLLKNQLKAESKSRQGNGLLLIPNTFSVSVPARSTPAADDTDPDAIDDYPDDLEEPVATSIGEALEEAMLDPIEDPSSPWSVLRTILVGPPDDLDKAKVLDLDRPSMEKLEDHITSTKRSIAEGLPMPIEVTEGHMNTTFANAAQIDQDIFEKYLEPDCVTICDMWTIGLLTPALVAGGTDPDAERIFVWYDASQLVDESTSPVDHVEAARLAGAIGNEAVRRFYGFSEDDAPEPIEMLIDAILKQRTWDPALVDAVIAIIAPDLVVPDPATGTAAAGVQLVAALEQMRADGPNPSPSTRAAVLAGLAGMSKVVRASASPKPKFLAASEKFGAGDTTLATKTLATLNAAMTRALQKAGNRLKAKAGPTREQLRLVAPEFAASVMGRRGLELAGLNDEDLIDSDAFDTAVNAFHRDAKHTQEKALALAAGLAGLSSAQKRQLAQRQAASLNDATVWMREELHRLASERLFNPDDTEPAAGEFDPSARVPAGLVRYAMALAGGATALAFTASNDRDRYVALSNEKPMGGIGTGELIQEAMTSGAATTADSKAETVIVIEGWMWDYGTAYRFRPYEPHEELDGQVAESSLDFPSPDGAFGDYCFPGDHDGCACGPLIPVYAEVSADSVGPGAVAADLFGEGD